MRHDKAQREIDRQINKLEMKLNKIELLHEMIEDEKMKLELFHQHQEIRSEIKSLKQRV